MSLGNDVGARTSARGLAARLLFCFGSALLGAGCANGFGDSGFGVDSTSNPRGGSDAAGSGGSSGGNGTGSSGGGSSSSGGGASGSGSGGTGGSSGGDAGSGQNDSPPSCAAGSVVVTVVDYFSGQPIQDAAGTADGSPSGSGPSLCFSVAAGTHPISITAGGYATYNGAIQVPGGAMTRTVSLFPVGPSLAGWLALVNSDRAANGAPPVQLDDMLTIAAWDHAVDMGSQGYFAHFDPHGFAPTTRSLLLGSMLMGAESCAAGDTTYGEAEGQFMAEKSMLPSQSASDCAQYDSLAGHYCNLVWASHNWVGLAIVNVPGSTYGTYYDQEFGDLYAYYDTTVLPPEPALGSTGSLEMSPAPGQSFDDEYFATLGAPTPIPIATLNADPTCSSMCPSGDQWFGTDQAQFTGNPSHAVTPSFTQSQIVFAAIDTGTATFEDSAAWAAFWPGGTVMPDTYGASSAKYRVP